MSGLRYLMLDFVRNNVKSSQMSSNVSGVAVVDG